MIKEEVICPNCKSKREIRRRSGNEGKMFKCKECGKKVMPYIEEIIPEEVTIKKKKEDVKLVDYSKDIVVDSIWKPRGWKTEYKVIKVENDIITIELHPSRGWVEDTRVFSKTNFLRHYKPKEE